MVAQQFQGSLLCGAARVAMNRTLSSALLAFTLLPAGLSADVLPQSTARVEMSDDAMGTTFSVVAIGRDRPRVEAAARAALDEAQRLDRLLSNYRNDSEWSAMNRGAARAPFKVSPELFDLPPACLAYSRASDGAFDITVGPLMKVWGFYKGDGALPRPDEVTQALDRIGYRHVVLNARDRTVRFDRDGIELDPGG